MDKALVGAIVGAIVGAAVSGVASFLVARWQMKNAQAEAERQRRRTRDESVYAELLTALSSILDQNTAKRLKENRRYADKIWRKTDRPIKKLWLIGGKDAGDEYRACVDAYVKAAEAYADNELSEEDFEEHRIKTSEEVASLLRRYMKEFGLKELDY